MEIVHKACAGLDVHKKTVVAAIIVPGERGGLRKEVRTFGTMTSDLLALSDWLMACEVSHVAMESTGEYWKPVFNILENNFEVLLVNAQHIKAVPGRKTDIKDLEWIAELHCWIRHWCWRETAVSSHEDRNREPSCAQCQPLGWVWPAITGWRLDLADLIAYQLGFSVALQQPSLLSYFTRAFGLHTFLNIRMSKCGENDGRADSRQIQPRNVYMMDSKVVRMANTRQSYAI